VTEPHRRLAAIMFTDMVGYSALAQADEATALALLDRHNRMLRPLFAEFGGREVKTIGDAFLIEFESALEAVQSALEIQRTLHDYNATAPPERKIRIRIGIHVGDVVQTAGDVLGDAVNIASRIEPLAEPEGICVSQQVVDQVQNKVAAPLVKMPPVELKNIHVPMSVYRVVPPWGVPPAPTSASAKERQLAVLPLANISPDPKDEYFADGLTEELISVLSQVRGLSVIARTSVTPYKSASKSIAQIGAELGVDTVLEGSVRKADRRLRITLQLVDVATQRHIWANSYNREVDDVFAVQSDIAERTAESLRLELSKRDATAAPRRPTANPAAYDLYLRGLVAAREADGAGFAEAVRFFERATELDPTFAEAYAAWANQYVVASGDYLPMREVMPKARKLAARALELDPESSEAHAALANIALQFDHDWVRSEAEFARAIALNPNNVVAHRFYALMLISSGRFDEAKEELRRAIVLDPGGWHRTTLSWAELESGNRDAALELAEEELRASGTSLETHTMLGLFYLQAGRLEEARREADSTLPETTDTERFDHALLNALVGRPDAARAIAAEVERGEAKSYTSPAHLAMLYAAIGERAKALDLLEKDFAEGDQVLWLFYRGVFFDSLRNEPRFVALLEKYGIPNLSPRRWPSPGPGATAGSS